MRMIVRNSIASTFTASQHIRSCSVSKLYLLTEMSQLDDLYRSVWEIPERIRQTIRQGKNIDNIFEADFFWVLLENLQ